MGYRFVVEHANLVAFVTTPAAEAPRAAWSLLDLFLDTLKDPANFLSGASDTEWADNVRDAASKAREIYDSERRTSDQELAASTSVQRILAPVRRAIGTYRLYAMLLPPPGQALPGAAGPAYEQLRSSGLELAVRSREYALVLFPEGDFGPGRERALDALPPSVAFAQARESDTGGGGLLVWTDQARSAFVPRERVHHVVHQLLSLLDHAQAAGDPDLNAFIEEISGVHYRRILHLSDLHLGSKESYENQLVLNARLPTVMKAVDHIVITGDLIDTPNERSAYLFDEFNNNLHSRFGSKPLLIPGNHDMRRMGTFRKNYDQVINFHWEHVQVFDNTKTVFISFNSSVEGTLARGRITLGQLARVGGLLETTLSVNEAARRYLKVVLVHHHPISFKAEPSGWVQQAIGSIGLAEPTLILEDGNDLLDWCARWDVSAILHGHKHVARHFRVEVAPADCGRRVIDSIGCGTSLGAEGYPCSFDIVSWNEGTNTWAPVFYKSIKGGPFLAEHIGVERPGATGSVPLAGAA